MPISAVCCIPGKVWAKEEGGQTMGGDQRP